MTRGETQYASSSENDLKEELTMRSIRFIDRMGIATAMLALFAVLTLSEGSWVGKTEAKEPSRVERAEARIHFAIGGVT